MSEPASATSWPSPAPQGSFTDHFRSKEEFAREVLDRYFDDLTRLVVKRSVDRSRTPRQRLRRYLDLISDRLAKAEFGRGCLIGDFSLEAAPQSERLRLRLAESLSSGGRPSPPASPKARAADEIASRLCPGRPRGIPPVFVGGRDPQMKVERNGEPLERFKRIVFATVFKEPLAMNPDVSLPMRPVLDSEMAYREVGAARMRRSHCSCTAIRTSSYNLAQHPAARLADVAHCVAPDLIGFGQSGKPDIDYRFEDHVRYLDAFLAKAGIGSAYLVAQDWGTALAFHLAARRPEFVRGLAFMEFVRPYPAWEDFLQGLAGREIFRSSGCRAKARPDPGGEPHSSSGCCRARCGAS